MTALPKAKLPVPGVNTTLYVSPLAALPPFSNHASAADLVSVLGLYQGGSTSILSLLIPKRASLRSVEDNVEVKFIVKTTGRRLDSPLIPFGQFATFSALSSR